MSAGWRINIDFVSLNGAEGKIAISQLGFGCARIYGGIERRHAAGLLEHAYELGVRHFDTAPLYGHGESEDIVGAVFDGVKDITVTTKVGLPRPQGAPSFISVLQRLTLRRILSCAPKLKKRLLLRMSAGAAEPIEQAKKKMRRDFVLRELDDSFKRLRRDRVTLYCIHEPDQYVIDEELCAVFEDLKACGRISAYGLAYGREVQNAPLFGHAVQASYSAESTRDGRLRMFHGLLRASSPDGPARLATAMREQPDAVFIVSVSERHQLTDLVRRIGK